MLQLNDHPFPHVCHTISGKPSVADIALALEYSLQHQDIPILWDLRAMESDEGLWLYGASMASSMLGAHKQRMSASKRAFVVADAQASAGIEMLLGRVGDVPWPWAVFWTLDEALDWLGDDA